MAQKIEHWPLEKLVPFARNPRTESDAQVAQTAASNIILDHLNETQKRAYIIADNELALNAGWDDELLRRN